MEHGSFFSFLTDSALEMIIAFSTDGIISYCNMRVIKDLEYDTDEMCGQHIDRIYPEIMDKISVCNKDIKAEREFLHVENIMAYRKNMTCFPVDFRYARINEREYVCMAMNIADIRQLESENAKVKEEAQVALNVKSEFVANVTHELRTPVNGLLGNTLELKSIETDAKKINILDLMERGCNDMHAIINNILDFSKLEAGKFVLEEREFDFRKTIDYVKSNHINKITEKGLDFFVAVSPEVPNVLVGDELKLVQILNNLLSNACKFTTVGKIALEVVKTAQKNNKVELFFIVIDTGIGMDKKDQDKLFKSFSQVDASISRKYGGTGLGLNISKQLVELMDGHIHVESEKNKGSMFSFSIWVEVPKDAVTDENLNTDAKMAVIKAKEMTLSEDEDKMKVYGEKENLNEIHKKMSKLILSVEMENWEKAEIFAEAIKQLTNEAPKDIKMAAFKMKMAVQKSNYDKTQEAYKVLEELLEMNV